jgi:hypothetical protein
MRFKVVDDIPGYPMGWLHIYILMQGPGFAAFYFGAQPERKELGNWGRLRATAALWGLGAGPDWSARFVHEITKTVNESCANFTRYFTLYTERTNGEDFNYFPTGRPFGYNSNHFAYTLLSRTGLLRVFTDQVIEAEVGSLWRIRTPGWGTELPIF